jgi:hypothetical protein
VLCSHQTASGGRPQQIATAAANPAGAGSGSGGVDARLSCPASSMSGEFVLCARSRQEQEGIEGRGGK